MKTESKGCLILLVIALAPMLYVANYLFNSESGINEQSPKLSWLPDNATAATYYADSWGKYAEFSIDRVHFENWCRAQGKELQIVAELTDSSDYFAFRATGSLENKGLLPPPELPTGREAPNEMDEWQSRYRKTFKVGDLYYSEQWSNGGGFWIGYDVREHKAYFSYLHN